MVLGGRKGLMTVLLISFVGLVNRGSGSWGSGV